MRRLSVSVKFSLLILSAIIAASGLLSWFFLDVIHQEVRDQLFKRGAADARHLANAVAAPLLANDEAKIRKALQDLLENPDVLSAAVVDVDGKVRASDSPGAVDLAFDQEGDKIVSTGCTGHREPADGERIVFSNPSTFDKTQVGCVVLQVSRRPLKQALFRASLHVLGITAAIALVVTLLSLIFLRRTMAPLNQVIEGTRRIAEGDFSTRLSIDSHDELGELSEAFNSMAARTDLFFRYVDKSIAERLARDESLARPGGSLMQITVLFGDMRGYTSLSHERSPSEMVWILNSYYDVFFQVVHHFDGVVDKTMGDAIMAFFEPARAGGPKNAERGILACAAMRGAVWVIARVLSQADRFGIPRLVVPCNFGFALATGRLIVGNIGSEHHMDYTVCGPAVNLAARLQLDTQQGEIMLDRFTAIDAGGTVKLKEMPKVQPKGFDHGHEVTPYVVAGLAESQLSEVRELLRRVLSETYFLRYILPSSSAGRSVPPDVRQKWSQHLTAIARELIDGDLSQSLIT